MLKPALARGQLQCIGATTLDEYRNHIEPDPALSRRFQVDGRHPPMDHRRLGCAVGQRACMLPKAGSSLCLHHLTLPLP
jgi:hypothetical protein